MMKQQSIPPWKPRFTITPLIAQVLIDIESVRVAVAHTRLSLAEEAKLRHQARVRATHYSTWIEGNRLTLAEAKEVIEKPKRRMFHGRERDVREVANYWNALLRVEEWANQKKPLTENLIQRIHALVEKGRRSKPTPYRTGQNVIRNAASGMIVYLPPEAKDVPNLMAEMVRWAEKAEKDGMPVPIIAGLIHYQFVTIHPYFDGNSRTARLLATFILHRGGFGLNGFFSMEEHHARDIEGYYRGLATHQHHNYYEGRIHTDLTGWVEYFTKTLAAVFKMVRDEISHRRTKEEAEPEALRNIDRRARIVLGLFEKQDTIRTVDIANALGLSERMARVLAKTWVTDGWLTVKGTGKRNRGYGLTAIYRQYIGNLTAMPSRE